MSTQADFLKGDAEDLSIDSDGRLFLGPSPSVVAETSAPFLWTVIDGADGTMWAGSGNEGQVLKVTKDGKLSTFFDAGRTRGARARAGAGRRPVRRHVARREDLPGRRRRHVASLLRSRTTSTSGRWSSTRPGNVFAATGDKGIIYKITPDGQGTPFYKTNAGNVVSLVLTAAGDLIAGTESPGRVFKIDRGRQGVRAARLAVS